MNLRPMQMSDADFMLELKNDPQTREFALLTQDEIKREDHMKWLPKHIDEFQIIEEEDSLSKGKTRVGAIRIQENDFSESKSVPDNEIKLPFAYSEISIWICRGMWGWGLGTKAIEMVKKAGMIAKIVNPNIGSMRAFIKAGFVPIRHISNRYFVFIYYERQKIWREGFRYFENKT